MSDAEIQYTLYITHYDITFYYNSQFVNGYFAIILYLVNSRTVTGDYKLFAGYRYYVANTCFK